MTLNTSRMIRVKSTHPSFRRMILVDEDFLAAQSERSAPASTPAPATCVVERPVTETVKKPEQEGFSNPPITTSITSTLPVTQLAGRKRKPKVTNVHPVTDSLAPGHSFKVLRLYK